MRLDIFELTGGKDKLEEILKLVPTVGLLWWVVCSNMYFTF